MWAAKQFIIDHVPGTWNRTFKNKYTSYGNSMYFDIYDHLIEEYGELLDEEMQENNALLKKR